MKFVLWKDPQNLTLSFLDIATWTHVIHSSNIAKLASTEKYISYMVGFTLTKFKGRESSLAIRQSKVLFGLQAHHD